MLDQRSNPRGEGNSKRDYMISCGVDVKGDARYPIMHDKFIVVYGAHVETGRSTILLRLLKEMPRTLW